MINKILKTLENQKEIKNFSEGFSLYSHLNREFSIADIDAEVGEAIEAMIRFWNKVDEENGIKPENRKPIKIYINSGGGELHATFTIIDAIKMSKTPVYTINIGSAYSGGFFIFISGHKRLAYPKATFLYHEGSTGGMRQDANKFDNFASFYKKQLETLKDITLQNTKIDEELYEEHKRDDWWIFSDEALKLGICDEIITEFI